MIENTDRLRTALRGILPQSVYQKGADALDSFQVVRKEGCETWQRLREASRKDVRAGGDLISLSLRCLEHPFFIRQGTPDAHHVISCIIRGEYGRLPLMTEPKWMIDAGAYIGDTSVYFLNRFRDLRVIAIEANPQNYKIARQNLAPYASRCTLLQKGVWKSNSKLRLKNDLNFTYVEEVPREQAEFDLEGIQIDTIMSEHQIPRISILKMDIEGAEAHVFSSPDQNWLSKTDLLIIEIHNAEAFSAVEKALSKLQFRMIKWRSVFYCYK